MSNNEQQICRLNLALTRDFERSEKVQQEIYDLGVFEKKEEVLIQENPNYVKFHRAANN